MTLHAQEQRRQKYELREPEERVSQLKRHYTVILGLYTYAPYKGV
jgi:hypothetical protein